MARPYAEGDEIGIGVVTEFGLLYRLHRPLSRRVRRDQAGEDVHRLVEMDMRRQAILEVQRRAVL